MLAPEISAPSMTPRVLGKRILANPWLMPKSGHEALGNSLSLWPSRNGLVDLLGLHPALSVYTVVS